MIYIRPINSGQLEARMQPLLVIMRIVELLVLRSKSTFHLCQMTMLLTLLNQWQQLRAPRKDSRKVVFQINKSHALIFAGVNVPKLTSSASTLMILPYATNTSVRKS